MKLKFNLSIENCWECPFRSYIPDDAIKYGYSHCSYSDFILYNKYGIGIDKQCDAEINTT